MRILTVIYPNNKMVPSPSYYRPVIDCPVPLSWTIFVINAALNDNLVKVVGPKALLRILIMTLPFIQRRMFPIK